MATTPAPLLTGPTLALSGGGFRSTLFQVGTLIRLNELCQLRQLKCISSVSGGSIASAFLGLQWPALAFDATGFATAMTPQFVNPLMAFCAKSIDIPAVLEGLVNPFKHVGQELIEAYDKDLFTGKTLQDLPDASKGDAPRFVFNATSMQSGVRFWFSRESLGDYRIGQALKPTTKLSEAVAASSAFPPFFAPLAIDISGLTFSPCVDLNGKSISNLFGSNYQQTAQCVDGGTYDNMALETIWGTYDSCWVSDAGSPFEPSVDVSRDWFHEMLRVIDLMMRAGEAERRRVLLGMFHGNGSAPPTMKGAYWGLTTNIAHLHTNGALALDPKKVEPLAGVSTRLSGIPRAQQEQLVNLGYALADASVRSGVSTAPITGAAWPFPKNALS